MDEKIKTWTLRLPVKESPNMEKALFDALSCCSMTSKKSIDWFLESSSVMKFFHPFVCCFFFGLGVFISRSYENRSNNGENKYTGNDSCKNKFAHLQQNFKYELK